MIDTLLFCACMLMGVAGFLMLVWAGANLLEDA